MTFMVRNHWCSFFSPPWKYFFASPLDLPFSLCLRSSISAVVSVIWMTWYEMIRISLLRLRRRESLESSWCFSGCLDVYSPASFDLLKHEQAKDNTNNIRFCCLWNDVLHHSSLPLAHFHSTWKWGYCWSILISICGSSLIPNLKVYSEKF